MTRRKGSPAEVTHEVHVAAIWHNDSTAGLEVACSCGKILREDDDDSWADLDAINEAARAHLDAPAPADPQAGE